ncbi:MAG: GSCFA domain-containing protein, partial [Saprospiraceae bacterium]|nr:GSCFA domain-containing protein [Saprospiraceae bacterium]
MFRTELKPRKSSDKISYNDSIVTLGSCFAQTIGSRLERNKFDVLPNPFGVIFNPLAQFKLLQYVLNNEVPEDYTFIESQNIWYNYDFHSDYSALSKDELQMKVEGTIKQTRGILQKSNWLLLTFGTSIGYHLISNEQMVANCHKIPADQFTKDFVSQKQILASFDTLYSELKKFNPHLNIILTVSPVRHLKETLELSSVSKSILRIAAHSIQKEYENVNYFPAYELLLDDLRDYRFYTKDMLHPNETGEEYIWDKFCSSYMEEDSMTIIKDWEKVRRSLEHK